MRVPLFDLAPYHARIRDRVNDALMRVYDSGVFLSGSELARFETELAERMGFAHVVGVSSGTDALVAALLAIDVDRASEVVTTPFTFFATASAIRAVGARVRFADIEPEGFGLDPSALGAACTGQTRAVIAVHLFGEPCQVRDVLDVCRPRGLPLIEDAAQALGARVQGRSVGTFGALGCFSFFPAKPLGALGDGGAVTTEDPGLAARLRRIRAHGAERKHEHIEHGGNFRLDELQASVLRLKLRDLSQRIAANRRHAAHYDAAFADVASVRTPRQAPEGAHSLYTLRVLERREALVEALAADGIASQVHYPKPLHLQPALRELGHARGDFPNAERRAREVLSLPLFPELTAEQRDHVVARVRAFFA